MKDLSGDATEIKFRTWLKKTYGIQDYNAYANTQTEEIAIRYAQEMAPGLYELCKQQHEALKKCANEIMAPSVDLQVYTAIEAFNKLME